MRKLIGGLCLALALLASGAPAQATWLLSPGTGAGTITIWDITGGSGNCASNHCLANVPVDATGTPLFSNGNPGFFNLSQLNGAAPSLTNPLWVSPATGATFPVSGTVTVGNANTNGQATMANSSPVAIASNQSNLPVINGGSRYQAVAASQTAAVLQSSAGATGDYLSHCVIYPATTSPGAVTVFDNTNTAANSTILFAGGASSVSNLAPIPVPVGALSLNGAWKVTTSTNVSVVCYGKFSALYLDMLRNLA